MKRHLTAALLTTALVLITGALPAAAAAPEPPSARPGWDTITQEREFGPSINPCTGDTYTASLDRVIHINRLGDGNFVANYWTYEETTDGWSSNGWVMAQAMPGSPKVGEAIYKQHCLRCHGQLLDGNGPEGRYLITRPADFHSLESRLKTDWELLIEISHGALFSPMHGWRDRLTDQEMLDVLAYIRLMAPPGVIG